MQLKMSYSWNQRVTNKNDEKIIEDGKELFIE